MRQRSDFLDRARMTVERAALVLRDLCDDLDEAAGGGSCEQHALWDIVNDLEWRHSLLLDSYLAMTLSPLTELGDHWQRFSICHDDYRDAVREARSGLRPLYRGGAAHTAIPGPGPGAAGTRPPAES